MTVHDIDGFKGGLCSLTDYFFLWFDTSVSKFKVGPPPKIRARYHESAQKLISGPGKISLKIDDHRKRKHRFHMITHPTPFLAHRWIRYYYRPQRSLGKVIFSQASLILLTGGRGRVPAPEGGGLVETPLPGRLLLRAVHILLECILVVFVFSLFCIISFWYLRTMWSLSVVVRAGCGERGVWWRGCGEGGMCGR